MGKLQWLSPASLGLQFAFCILIGWYFGHRLEEWLSLEPFGTLGGLLLGAAAGFLSLFKEMKALDRQDAAEAKDKNPHEP
jgi:F0F1-type ATP synthase assembly protein I